MWWTAAYNSLESRHESIFKAEHNWCRWYNSFLLSVLKPYLISYCAMYVININSNSLFGKEAVSVEHPYLDVANKMSLVRTRCYSLNDRSPLKCIWEDPIDVWSVNTLMHLKITCKLERISPVCYAESQTGHYASNGERQMLISLYNTWSTFYLQYNHFETKHETDMYQLLGGAVFWQALCSRPNHVAGSYHITS